MTREQALHCSDCGLTVEVCDDENFKTGIILEVINSGYAIVQWDDPDGTEAAVALSDLVVQYPEQMEAVA
jgi:hypothetical protein